MFATMAQMGQMMQQQQAWSQQQAAQQGQEALDAVSTARNAVLDSTPKGRQQHGAAAHAMADDYEYDADFARPRGPRPRGEPRSGIADSHQAFDLSGAMARADAASADAARQPAEPAQFGFGQKQRRRATSEPGPLMSAGPRAQVPPAR